MLPGGTRVIRMVERMISGFDLYRADPAQPLTTAGGDEVGDRNHGCVGGVNQGMTRDKDERACSSLLSTENLKYCWRQGHFVLDALSWGHDL